MLYFNIIDVLKMFPSSYFSSFFLPNEINVSSLQYIYIILNKSIIFLHIVIGHDFHI
jgi:hypothetical protein